MAGCCSFPQRRQACCLLQSGFRHAPSVHAFHAVHRVAMRREAVRFEAAMCVCACACVCVCVCVACVAW